MVSGTKQIYNKPSQNERLDESGAERSPVGRGVLPLPLPQAAGEGLLAYLEGEWGVG